MTATQKYYAVALSQITEMTVLTDTEKRDKCPHAFTGHPELE